MVARMLAFIALPPFVRRRKREFAAFLLASLAFILLLSSMSYHPSDPSFNHVGMQRNSVNWLGSFGAFLADWSRQLFGWMTVLFIGAFCGWSWRLVHKNETFTLPWRIVALLLSVIMGGALLSFLAASTHADFLQHAGGAMGIVVALQLTKWLGFAWAFASAALLFFVTLPIAIGLKMDEWVAISSILRQGILRVAALLGALWHLLRRPKEEAFDEDEEEDEETLEDEEEEASDAEEAVEEMPKFRTPRLMTPKKRVDSKKSKSESAQSSLDLSERKGYYTMPSLNMLQKASGKGGKQLSESALEQNARMLESVLLDFGVKGEITRVRPGPVVTLYELEPAAGVRASRVIGLADDIARSMSAISARISVISGRNALGIELPNAHRETVYLRELFEEDAYSDTQAKLPLVLGKDISGEPIIADLARMPHVLVAGTTGSGKSVAINTMIMSLVYHMTPEQCKFIMIDPKMLELSVYDNIPHLLSPVVTEPGKAVVALKWAVKEMEQRYRLMSNLGVRNIDNYNKRIEEAKKKGEELTRSVQTGFDPETGKPIMEKLPLEMNSLPFIVVIVDEMADLMLVAGKDIEGSIQRLAQMARAAGIHIIMATQRPSVDVITGVIKANFPTRISFQVTSKIDSRTILGEQGAEQLLGQGDMLYMAGGGRVTRVHGPFITDKEVENIVSYLRTQGEPTYDAAVTHDPDEEGESGELFDEEEDEGFRQLYDAAVDCVVRDGKASTSYIQRRLKIGYNKAATIIEKMEKEGIVGPANHAGKREVLMRE